MSIKFAIILLKLHVFKFFVYIMVSWFQQSIHIFWKIEELQTIGVFIFYLFIIEERVHTMIWYESCEKYILFLILLFVSTPEDISGETTKAETLKVNTKMCYFIDKSRYISIVSRSCISTHREKERERKRGFPRRDESTKTLRKEVARGLRKN